MRSRELEVAELDPLSGAVREAWRGLAARCPDATIFQDPDWLLPWWAHLGAATTPWLLGVRAGGELIGLAPLGIRSQLGAREVTFLGGDVTDYFGVLAAPHARAVVARAVLDHLARAADRFDHAVLARLPACASLFAVPPPRALSCSAHDADVCPYVPMPEGARALSDAIPPGFAKRVAQSLRAAHRRGAFELVWIGPGGSAAFLESLFALHAARWRARGGEGVLAGACLQRFYREAVGALAPRGLARMLEVRLDGAPVAAVLAFAHRRRVLHYAAGFDPSAARLSPGRIALAALFSRAIAERAREVDLLRGVEPHKYDWGARDRTTRTLRITRA